MSIAETVESVRTMVAAGNLRDALTACMLSVGTEDHLPVLETVQIEKRGLELILRSTDRFRLTRVTVRLDADDMPSPDWTVLIDSGDVKRMLAAIPKPKRYPVPAPVSLSWLDDGGRDAGGHAVHGLSVDTGVTALRVQSFMGDFPRTDSLIPANDLDTSEVGAIGFNPKYMTDLCKMPGRDKNQPVRLRFRGEGKGAVSVWGDDEVRYEHLLMPVRLSD